MLDNIFLIFKNNKKNYKINLNQKNQNQRHKMKVRERISLKNNKKINDIIKSKF